MRFSAFVRALACGLLCVSSAAAQDPAPAADADGSLRVFLDCAVTCDADFLRREIGIVDYVRDRTDADVHILLTSAPSSGGTAFTLAFIGLRRFAGTDTTLTFATAEAATADDRRTALAATVKRGLVRYLAATALADRVQVTFTPAPPPAGAADAHDPWDLWVFRVNAGGSLSGETRSMGRSVRGTASANRTTDQWKLTFSATGNYRDDTFELSEAETFTSVARTLDATAIVVRAVSDHWSVGLVGTATSSTFLNYDLKARLASGVEYNVFPYPQSTRRMLTAQYTIGANSMKYREETIFGKTSERLADHRLTGALTMLQPWGTASGEVSFSQYLNRPGQYNVTAYGDLDVRLFRGVSLSVFSTISRTHDQIYLPRAGATVEEILVRQRQLETSYRYSLTLGITYSFGSIFNNVVNQRFGGVGQETLAF